MKRQSTVIMMVFLIAAVAGNGVAMNTTEKCAFQKLTKKAADATTGDALLKIYSSFLVHPNYKSQMFQLKHHANDSLAILAAWTHVRCGITEKEVGHLVFEATFRKGDIPWFLGYTEGRLRISAPQWWSSKLKNSNPYGHSGLSVFSKLGENNLPGSYKKIKTHHDQHLMVSLNGIQSMTWHAKALKMCISKDHGDVVLSRELIHHAEKHKQDVFYTQFHHGRVMVVSYSQYWPSGEDSEPATIWSLDAKSGKVLWKSKVAMANNDMSSWHGGSHQGLGPANRMSLVVKDNQILIFGQIGYTLMIEEFEAHSGKWNMGFSTGL